MPINKWRYVRYTDDGCVKYQCLMCYEGWEARTQPGFLYQGQYEATWTFCPYCGTRWESSTQRSDGCDDRGLGPRRRRIEDALRKHERSRPKPSFVWVIETQGVWPDRLDEPWWPVAIYTGETTSAYKIKERLIEARNQ